MNEVIGVGLFLSDEYEYLWVQIGDSSEGSLEAARLGLEMVFPGATVQMDAATQGLIVVPESIRQTDIRYWESITPDLLQATLRDAEYMVEIMPGTNPDVVVMELTHAPTYRLPKYLELIPGVNEAHLVEGLEQFVHLNISVSDVAAFCETLRASMSFGFSE